MKEALVVLSGGLDSTVTLAKCVHDFGKDNVNALIFFYGQRHRKEVHAAMEICKHYDVEYTALDISSSFNGIKCNLMDETRAIPEGHYKEQGEHPPTEVPFRNGIFVSIAASQAMAKGFKRVYIGIHADDAGAAYADTSVDFFASMKEAILDGTHHEVELCAPFVSKDKAYVVKVGAELKVPFELTWSCYEGGSKPCGKCATCLQRKEAFEKAGITEPSSVE